MKANAGKIVKVICFCLVVILMVNFLNDLFKPKFLENRWKFTKTTTCFYDLDKNNLEVALLGTSQMAAALDPMQLYKEHGIASYNLGIMSQPIQATYFWLKEVKDRQDIKLAVLEVKAMARTGLKVEVKARRSYDYMKLGLNKLQYAWEFNKTQDAYDDAKEVNIKEYLFPLNVYHSRWSSLEYDDFDFYLGNNETHTRGLATLTTQYKYHGSFDQEIEDKGEYDGFVVDTDEKENVHGSIVEYDVKLIEYAKENNIPLLFIKTPDTSWNVKQHNFVKELADKYDIDFIDFNLKEMREATGFDLSEDEGDTIHANILGAEKLTAYVGDYIAEHYDVTDFRKVDGNVKNVLEDELEEYELTMTDARLSLEYDYNTYLKMLNDDNYSVIIAGGSNTFKQSYLDAEKDKLKKYGVDDEAFEEKKYGANFVSVLDQGEKDWSYKAQNSEYAKSIYKGGTFADGTDYAITVSEKNVKVRLNNNNQVLVQNDKLNFIIYDNALHEVADIAYLTERDGVIILGRKEL